jgi:hypothetical protein
MGFARFPALKRVTAKLVAHGWIFTPLYQTSMIRAFPKGFNYAIPRGWPHVPDGTYTPEATPWQDRPHGKTIKASAL